MCKISKRSKISSRRRCHSPPTRREVPALLQAAEETPLVASPASSWVETSQFVFLWVFFVLFFLMTNTPNHHSLPPHQHLCFSPPSSNTTTFSTSFTCTHAITSMDPRVLSLCKPFVLILFSIKKENCWQKHFMYLPSPFHFSPSCSAFRLLGKAWRLACPSFSPLV